MTTKAAGKPVVGGGSMSELLSHNCEPAHKHLVRTPAKEDHMFGIFQHTVDKNMAAGADPVLPLPVKPTPAPKDDTFTSGETEVKHQSTSTFKTHEDYTTNKKDHSDHVPVAGVNLTTVSGTDSQHIHIHDDHVADVKHMHLVDGANPDHLNKSTKVTIMEPTQKSHGDHMHQVDGANSDHWGKGQVDNRGDETVASAITGHHVHGVEGANVDHVDNKTAMDNQTPVTMVPTMQSKGDHLHRVVGANEDHWGKGTIAPEDTHGHMHMVAGANSDHWESGQKEPKHQHNTFVPGANKDHWESGQIDKQGQEEAKTSITGLHVHQVDNANTDHILPGSANNGKKPHHLDTWDCGPVKPRVKHMHLVEGANQDHYYTGGNDGKVEITGHHVHKVAEANGDHWEKGQTPGPTEITGHHVHEVKGANPDHFEKGNVGGDAKLHFGPSTYSKHAYHKHLVKGESGVDDMATVLSQSTAFAPPPPQAGRNPLKPSKKEVTSNLPTAGKFSGIGEKDSAPLEYKPADRKSVV